MNANQTPTNPARRRLAKGGMAAAPVVLASLSSKNAFALAYQCFPSGKLSNNTSAFGPNPERDNNPSCTLNSSTAQATSALNGNPTTINSLFNGVAVYRRPPDSSGNVLLTTNPNGQNVAATLYDVLVGKNATGQNQPPVQNLDVLKKAVVIYFNAKGLNGTTDTQPLTEAQAIQLINAKIAGTGASLTTAMGTPLMLTVDGVNQYFNQLVV